jgi:hypothetical protein
MDPDCDEAVFELRLREMRERQRGREMWLLYHAVLYCTVWSTEVNDHAHVHVHQGYKEGTTKLNTREKAVALYD